MSPGHYMTWRHSNWSWLIIVILLLYIISILLLYISTQRYDMNAADLPKLYWRSLQDVILKRHPTGHNTSKLILKHWSHAQSCKSCLRFFAMSDKDSMRISSLVRFWFRTWKISCWVWTNSSWCFQPGSICKYFSFISPCCWSSEWCPFISRLLSCVAKQGVCQHTAIEDDSALHPSSTFRISWVARLSFRRLAISTPAWKLAVWSRLQSCVGL